MVTKFGIWVLKGRKWEGSWYQDSLGASILIITAWVLVWIYFLTGEHMGAMFFFISFLYTLNTAY